MTESLKMGNHPPQEHKARNSHRLHLSRKIAVMSIIVEMDFRSDAPSGHENNNHEDLAANQHNPTQQKHQPDAGNGVAAAVHRRN